MTAQATQVPAAERTAAPPRPPRRRAALVIAPLVAVLLAGAAVVAVPHPAGGGLLEIDGTDRAVRLPDYGRDGSEVLGYQHGRSVTMRFTVRNRGLLPLTITSLDAFPERLGLLSTERVLAGGAPLPATVGPRGVLEVEVTGHFDNCEYYTERAVNVFAGAAVGWKAAGIARQSVVAYPDQVVVRSPTIVDCPGRVLDRSAKQRNAEGTITGRG